MKAVIVTTQHINNYGAVLQAYGLHRFLQIQGHEHSFLAQITDGNQIYEKITPLGKNTIAGLYYNTLIYLEKKSIVKRISYFDKFCKQYIPQVSQNDLADFDLYISGGDQLFNRSCLRTPANFLYFGRKEAKRISFCTSMGSAQFTEEEYQIIGKALNRYSEVSLREETSVKALQPYVNVPMRTDIDCSFLIDETEWDKIAKPVLHELPQKFILVYELMHHNDIGKVVEKIRKEKRLPVVAILTKPRKSFQADVTLYDVGPQEFIWLFKNASYIVTTSFHGTCFSIINKKPFTVLVQENEKRITNLLNVFGLSENYKPKYDGKLIIEIPDYSIAERRIKDGRLAAKQYFEKYFISQEGKKCPI